MKQGNWIFLLLLLFACKQEKQETQTEVIVPVFEKSQVNESLENLFKDVEQWNGIYPSLRFGDTLSKFYAQRNYKPLWAFEFYKDTTHSKLLEVLYSARFDGLDPNFYEHDSLVKAHSSVHQIEMDKRYALLAYLELKFSDHLLSFHRDRKRGRVEPDSLFKSGYKLPRNQYEDFDLMSVLNSKRYAKVLEQNSHKDKLYVQYQGLLHKYYSKIDSGEHWYSIDTTGIKKIEVGDSVTIMPQVAAKLNLMGLISDEEAALADSFVYNKAFKPYVERVQERFGLFKDGVLGKKTLKLINTSLDDRLDQVMANMERHRWYQTHDEAPSVLVNLPAFELELFYEDSVSRMNVCIGKARPDDYDEKYEEYLEDPKWWKRPRDFETPQVSSEIHYLVVNPTWTVPKSIITREMFHQMKRDSTYLRTNGYGVFYKGEELNADSIDWSKYKADKIPFNIVQQAGEKNALGKVKFIFPNPFHVYLHDTPQKSKFKWTERAVSHGCVRVQNPLQLGEFLMTNHKKYDSDDFRILMGYEPLDEERLKEYDPEDTTAEIRPLDSTTILRLQKTVPVNFIYRTIWFDDEGQAQYRTDVYDKNRKIIEAMREPEQVKF